VEFGLPDPRWSPFPAIFHCEREGRNFEEYFFVALADGWHANDLRISFKFLN
jgi:hypothetical protein